jgi:hypothetical protein
VAFGARLPEPMLRQPVSVERRGIKKTDAAGVGSLQCRVRPLLRDALVEITERGAAHTKHADLQRRPANLSAVETCSSWRHSIDCGPSPLITSEAVKGNGVVVKQLAPFRR